MTSPPMKERLCTQPPTTDFTDEHRHVSGCALAAPEVLGHASPNKNADREAAMAGGSRESRREFLKLTALGAAGALAAPAIGSTAARAAPKSLTMMHESSFVPPFDAFFKNKLAAAYEKETGIKVNYEVVSVGSLQARVTTTAENNSGPDLATLSFNWAFLFDEKLVDLSGIAAEIGKESGGWYDTEQEAVIDSDETARAVDYCRRLYKETMLEDCLGWTDVNNNKAFLSEQISCTNNAESILWAAKKDFPDMAKVIDQSENPKGPKGRFHMLNPQAHAIFSHTPDKQAAKDFLRWLMVPKQLGPWYDIAVTYYQPFLHAYDDAPMWKVEPRNLPYRDALKTAHLPGWPQPLSRAQSETIAKFVVIDMFAKACAGKSTKEVIADAKAQLTQIYKTA